MLHAACKHITHRQHELATGVDGGDDDIMGDIDMQIKKMKLKKNDKTNIISMPACGHFIAPLVYVIPMQLLSYYVAINKKTNIDLFLNNTQFTYDQ